MSAAIAYFDPAPRALLARARERTLALAADLDGERLLGPRLDIVNPALWELGHVAWFQEQWCLRARPDGTWAASVLAGADALYDSSRVPHATRWDLPLPGRAATLAYLEQVLDQVLERLERAEADERVWYFAWLAACHEEMHCEAFTYSRQTLGYPAPQAGPQDCRAMARLEESCTGDVEIPAGSFELGARPGGGSIVFDNEKWAHPVEVAAFRIARAAVTNGEFLEFVLDSGYRRPELWDGDGWRWREAAGLRAPVYWIERDGTWRSRRYDEEAPLDLRAAVMHVNWHEAVAYCRWAGRRLPTEAEWERAAATGPGAPGKRVWPWGDEPPTPACANLYGGLGGAGSVSGFASGDSAWGCRQMMGNVWEWTSERFGPYPGFEPDPYQEYSQPWFGTHRVLRGGSHATRAELMRTTWRNFFTPERHDIFAGFRTCAI